MNPTQFILRWGKPKTYYRDEFPYHHSTHGLVCHVTCTFCEKKRPDLGPDKGHHNMVKLDTERFRCIRCGTSGTIKFLIANGHVESEMPEIDQDYQQTLNTPKSSGWNIGPTIRLSGLPRTHVAWDFLRKDGFTDMQIEHLAHVFDILYCERGKQVGKHESNTTTHRIIFSLRGENNKITGWQARWLPQSIATIDAEWTEARKTKTSKYLISPGFEKNRFPYNKEDAWKNKTIVAVEGIKKVWKTGLFSFGTFGMQAGTPPPLSFFKNGNLPWYVEALLQQKHLVFLFDRSGTHAAMELAMWYITNGGKAQVIPLPEKGPDDLDDYSTKEIHAILRQHIPAGELPAALRA